MNKAKSKLKRNIYDFHKHLGKNVSIGFIGGRTITGILKSYDTLENIILDNVEETNKNGESRQIGLVFAKGNSIEYFIPGELEPIGDLFKSYMNEDFKNK